MTAHLKADLPGDIAHGFFGRAGGVSSGIYQSLNTGLGTQDDLSNVAENRTRCREALGADFVPRPATRPSLATRISILVRGNGLDTGA